MISVIPGIAPKIICETLESIDDQLEKKLEKVVVETLEKVKQGPLPEDKELLFYEAQKITLEAFEDFKLLSTNMFTTSLEKELAEAWINGCYTRFTDPRSLQKEVREILASKI